MQQNNISFSDYMVRKITTCTGQKTRQDKKQDKTKQDKIKVAYYFVKEINTVTKRHVEVYFKNKK